VNGCGGASDRDERTAAYADVIAAARAVVARWREVKRADDEIALLDVALSRLPAHEVEGEVPSAWYLDMKVRCQQLEKRLAAAEAYIPQRDFEDYRNDADRAAA